MEGTGYIEAKELILDVGAGVSLHTAMRDAAKMAIVHWIDVRFVFNDKPYTLKVKDILKSFKEE